MSSFSTSDLMASYIIYSINIACTLVFLGLSLHKSFCNFKPFRKRSTCVPKRGQNTPRNLALCVITCYLIAFIADIPDPSLLQSVLSNGFKYCHQYGIILSQCLLYILSLSHLRFTFNLTPHRLADPVMYVYFTAIIVLFLSWTVWEILSEGDRIEFDGSKFDGYLCSGLVLYNMLIAGCLIYSFNVRLSAVISSGGTAVRGSRALLLFSQSRSESIALGNDMYNNDDMEMYEVPLSARQSSLLDTTIRGALLNTVAVSCVQVILILWALDEMELIGKGWTAQFCIECAISVLSCLELFCVFLGFTFNGRRYHRCCGLGHHGCHLCCAKTARIELPRPTHKATDSIANYEFLM